MINRHYCIVTFKIMVFLLGRICDDLSWHQWAGVSTDGLKAIAVGGLTLSAGLTIAQRAYQEGGIKLLFIQSQVRFIIPWALVALVTILLFNIQGCHNSLSEEEHSHPDYYLDLAGCWLYSVTILLTNLNYSLICNVKGDLPILALFEVVLFAEIIYCGTLLLKLISELEGVPKDYATLFFSLMIAWQVLVMDLLFRAAYEEKEKQSKHDELERMVIEYREILEKYRKDEAVGSERLFKSEENNNLNEYQVEMNEIAYQEEQHRAS